MPAPAATSKAAKPAVRQKQQKQQAMIFGSSIVRHLNSGKIAKASKTNTKVNCYPGATIQEIEEHIEVKLKYTPHIPSTVIVHGGGNNLANGEKVSDVAARYEKLIINLKRKGIQTLAISGLTGRDNLRNEIPELNKSLRAMCVKHSIDFISNSFITFRYHLCWDKIHLNFDGVEQMEKNFSRYLNGPTIEDRK